MKVLSSWQLYGLMLLFQLGTSVVFGLAGEAKQNAWITVLISEICGLGIWWMYGKLHQTNPDADWSGLLSHAFGRFGGAFLSVVYVFIFVYSAARDLRDVGELTATFLLPKTPMPVTLFLFQLLVCYVCYAGVIRMGRMAELNVPVIMLFFGLEIVVLIASGHIRLSLLAPVADKWSPILTSAFPGSITVPYAEAFAFSTFWTMTKSPEQFLKAALLSAATAGSMLITLDIIAISTVGPELFSRSFFPLMTIFHMVNIGDFVQNIDPLIVTNYMIGVLFKVSVFTYAACAMISGVWGVPGHKAAAVPVSVMVLLFAIFMAKNLSSHLFTGHQWAIWVVFPPFFVAMPLIVLLVLKIKTVYGKGGG